LIINIILTLPTYCDAMIGIDPPFRKGFAGLLRQPEWGSSGEWEMGRRSDFGKTNGLVVVALQFSSGKFILLPMSKGSPLPRLGMGWTLSSPSGGLWVGVFCPNGKRWIK
jgi:hypothetical protein